MTTEPNSAGLRDETGRLPVAPPVSRALGPIAPHPVAGTFVPGDWESGDSPHEPHFPESCASCPRTALWLLTLGFAGVWGLLGVAAWLHLSQSAKPVEVTETRTPADKPSSVPSLSPLRVATPPVVAPPASGPLEPEPPVFGPVVERTLPLDPHFTSYIDFQTGDLVIKHWDLGGAPWVEKIREWTLQTGADAAADAPHPSTAPRLFDWFDGCEFVDARLAGFDETFDSVDARDADERLSFTDEQGDGMTITSEATTYWFKTRDGAKGVLRILGITGDPGGVRFQYKLVLPMANRASPSEQGPTHSMSGEKPDAMAECSPPARSLDPLIGAPVEGSASYGSGTGRPLTRY